jgi:hypothetical protein
MWSDKLTFDAAAELEDAQVAAPFSQMFKEQAELVLSRSLGKQEKDKSKQ